MLKRLLTNCASPRHTSSKSALGLFFDPKRRSKNKSDADFSSSGTTIRSLSTSSEVWADAAWEEYLHWQTQDKKTLKRINLLLKDIDRNGHAGIGKPEPLKHDKQGYWSRRIDDVNRLVYRIVGERIEIVQCQTHYDE